jgi:hypothetical protein
MEHLILYVRIRIPQPDVTAANADWEVNSSPIVVGG